MSASDHSPDRPADVHVRLPADRAYVSILRTMTAGLAARLDFTIDDIEDLRMVMGEAIALMLHQADPDGDLSAHFYLHEHRLSVTVAVDSTAPRPLDRDSFGWQVLTTLVTGVSELSRDGKVALRLTMESSAGDVTS